MGCPEASSLVVDSGFSGLVLEGSSRVSAGYSGLLLSCGWAPLLSCGGLLGEGPSLLLALGFPH